MFPYPQTRLMLEWLYTGSEDPAARPASRRFAALERMAGDALHNCGQASSFSMDIWAVLMTTNPRSSPGRRLGCTGTCSPGSPATTPGRGGPG